MRSPLASIKTDLRRWQPFIAIRQSNVSSSFFYIDISLIRMKFIVGLITVKVPNETIFSPLHSNWGVIEAGEGATYWYIDTASWETLGFIIVSFQTTEKCHPGTGHHQESARDGFLFADSCDAVALSVFFYPSSGRIRRREKLKLQIYVDQSKIWNMHDSTYPPRRKRGSNRCDVM